MAGWSQNTWNVGSWGTGVDNIVSLTGLSLSSSIGFISSTSTVELGWGRDQWGARSWGAPSQIVVPTTPEDDMTLSQGSVTTTGEINGGWNADYTWGTFAWGIAATLIAPSVSATMATGSAVGFTNVSPVPSGIGMTATLASVGLHTTTVAYPTGQSLTTTLANVDAGPDAMLTGNVATISVGTVEAYNTQGWSRLGWGDNSWGVEGLWTTVSVTGQALTATLGVETVEGHANVTANTLNVAQVTLGAVDPAPDAMIQGNFMIAALGTLGQGSAKTVTGFGLPITLASATVDLNTPVNVTGFALNNQLAGVTAFTDIDVIPTGFGLTMAVGSGSALIWNEVDTGSAPLEPPGWQIVAA